MVNMNLYKEPCIYGLHHDGRLFYVGYTSINALNRWWQHKSRANSGHTAPVYQKMRAVGIENVGWKILHPITAEDDPTALEATTIANLIESGHELVNEIGRDGVPNSFSEELRKRAGESKRGKPTWIKGKTGEEAGWTQERKAKMAERAAERRANREPRHGTNNEYLKYGCRCESCTKARIAEVKRLSDSSKNKRAWKNAGSRVGQVPKYKIHGEVACYKNGRCRCEPCTIAYRQYKRSISKTLPENVRPHQYKGADRIERRSEQ